jgi:hypothetical protein
MPCSSGNSPTMSVSRSILATAAARFGEVGVGAELFGDCGDAAQALGAVAQRAELVVIDHRAELEAREAKPFLRSWS